MMMPGLIELRRAPRSPHRTLAACTRTMLARLASAYAAPELVTTSGCRNGRAGNSSAGVVASAWCCSGGSGGIMWPAWLAITTPDPPAAMTWPNSSSTKATPTRSTADDRLWRGLGRGQSGGVHHISYGAKVAGGGGEGADGFVGGDVDRRRARGESGSLQRLRRCRCSFLVEVGQQDRLADPDPAGDRLTHRPGADYDN